VADPRVETALGHWAGRMVANGVPFADFEAIRGTLDRWTDWCAAWTRHAVIHEDLGDDAAREGRTRSAGEHWTTAAVVYHFAKFLFMDDREQAGAAHKRAVACRTQALPYLDPAGERREITFENTVLPGNLRLPKTQPAPLVVMISGLDSAKEEMHNHEQDFLARGVATFAFDGPGQGEVEGQRPIRPDFEVVTSAVIDHLSAHPGVDTERIGVWGVSLGGYYAPRSAAFDDRIKACVSLSGAFDFGVAWPEMPDISRAAFTIRSHSPDEATAGALVAQLTLRDVASRIRCPLLIVSGEKDRIFPPWHAEQLAEAVTGPVTRLHVDDGTHVVNNRPFRYRPYMADWLAQELIDQ
jgi:2,6-dihydroxypseudooxynicotine hydrolase